MRCAILLATGCRGLLGIEPATSVADAPAQGKDVAEVVDAAVDAGPVLIIVEAENAARRTPSATHAFELRTDVVGFAGTGFEQTIPADAAVCSDGITVPSCAPSLEFDVTIDRAGMYFCFARMFATTGGEDSLWFEIGGSRAALDVLEASQWLWVTACSITLMPGTHTVTLWMREAGGRVDAIAIGTDDTPPP